MNILLLGSGAREQAMANALKRRQGIKLYNIGSHINPGIQRIAHAIKIMPFTAPCSIVDYALAQSIDWVLIGPEKPLELGLADYFWQRDIPVVGPTQQLAQIETSKGYARDLMKKYAIAGLPLYQRFSHYNQETLDFLKSLNDNYVIKVDGLMSGKGVKVAGDHLHSLTEAVTFCGSLQTPFVIEEKLHGFEFSLLSFSDGKNLAHMPPVRDHKRLLEGDQGPNTGGMGTYTLANHRLPLLTDLDIQVAQAINEAVIQALLRETGQYYRGILYGGFIKTKDGVQVIEFNARFGDPEAINLLALLETDFASICLAICSGTLAHIPITFKKQASVCKYLVPLGYPDKTVNKQPLDVAGAKDQQALYYGSITKKDQQFTMLGSRAVAVLAVGETLNQAEQKVEEIIASIKGEFYHRSDIAKIKPLRIAILGSTQGSNLTPLYQQIANRNLPIEIALVVSNKEDAFILTRAQHLHLPTKYLSAQGIMRSDYDAQLNMILREQCIDLVLLIGFMRILSEEFTKKWQGRVLNVHPSLLPKYAGLLDLQVHAAVLAAGDQQSGCTVHWVEEKVDEGKIILQKKCHIDTGDTPQILKKKVQALEVVALLEVLESMCLQSFTLRDVASSTSGRTMVN